MATLYDLQGNYMQLMEMLQDPEYDIEAILNTMEIVEDDIAEKLENYGKVIKSIEAEIPGIEAEKSRLDEMIRTRKNRVKALKDRIGEVMILMDKRKVKTPLFSFNVQKNAPSLEIISEKSIPESFYEPQEPVLRKKDLLDAIKQGLEIEGVQIKQTESLRIR